MRFSAHNNPQKKRALKEAKRKTNRKKSLLSSLTLSLHPLASFRLQSESSLVGSKRVNRRKASPSRPLFLLLLQAKFILDSQISLSLLSLFAGQGKEIRGGLTRSKAASWPGRILSSLERKFRPPTKGGDFTSSSNREICGDLGCLGGLSNEKSCGKC